MCKKIYVGLRGYTEYSTGPTDPPADPPVEQ